MRLPNSDDIFASFSNSHNSFETPCCAYAHLKLARYLLRITRDSHYGDSMERVIDRRHSNVVALLWGPLALYAVADAAPAISRAEFWQQPRRERGTGR